MSERFSRVFTLSGSLYAAGAPVVISAGALLKDNQSGNIYAQLKYSSISNQRIKAVHIIITPFDTAGQSLGNTIEYQYLDLNAERGAEFGQKVPILVPDNHTRSFSIAVDEVIFQDNSKWQIENETWEPLPAPVSLVDAFPDENIRRQFQLDIGKDVSYIPTEHKDLWYCACGALNHAEESTCTKCGLELKSLLAANQPELLQRHYEQRKAEEEANAEKRATQRKKRKKIAAIGTPVIIFAIAVCYIVAVWIPRQKEAELEHQYLLAVELFEAGKYEEAISNFESILSYKDSESLVEESKILLQAQLEKIETIATRTEFYSDVRKTSYNCNEANDLLYVTGTSFVKVTDDGTVLTNNKAFDVENWHDIISISVGRNHLLGLKADGTVVATGDNLFGQCDDISNWSDIITIYAVDDCSIGIKSDGTVIAIGRYSERVNGLTNIKKIIFQYPLISLTLDGKVVVNFDDCNVFQSAWFSKFNDITSMRKWDNIVDIDMSAGRVVSLSSYGSVYLGNNDYYDLDIHKWKNVKKICADSNHIYGIKEDGTVIIAGEKDCVYDEVMLWENIKDIFPDSNSEVVGFKTDGTIVIALRE